MTKQFLLVIITCTLLSCTNNRTGRRVAVSKQDTFLPPKVTLLANLPDSLKPKIVLLDTMPAPSTIPLPTRMGGSYSLTLDDGRKQKIDLEPPVVKPLPMLRDAKGNVVKDSLGNTFIMGDAGKSNFTTFTTDNGLAFDAISCSKMDKAGNLWFGTRGGGVSRYDGNSFVTFSVAQGLASNYVTSLAEDKRGNLWFGTDGGVSRYDGKSFVTFSVVQGLADNRVWSIAEDKMGNLWFGTDGGVSRFDGKSFVTFSVGNEEVGNDVVWCIVVDKSGNLWFGTENKGVIRYDPSASPATGSKSFTTFSTIQGLANNSVRSIVEDKKGNMWFGTGSGVSRYDPSASFMTGSNPFVTFSVAHGLANNSVWSIAQDKRGDLWFATEGGGVSRLDQAEQSGAGSKSFTTFNTDQGLANNIVYTIVEDRTGNLWFGTEGGGVSRYNGKSFVAFSTVHGLAHNCVWDIAEDKTGNLWFATEGGVSRYDASASPRKGSKSFTNFSTAQGLANNQVFCIAEDKTGNLWFGTYGGGVSRYGPAEKGGTGSKSFTTFTTAQGLASNGILSMAEDRTGNMWFGTRDRGVCRFDGTSFVTFSVAQGLANNYVKSIAEDKAGNLWFGTDAGGVSRYDGNCAALTNTDKKDKKDVSKSFTTFSTAQGLANNSVLSIAEDKTGNLWFGTADGLSVMPASEAKRLNHDLPAHKDQAGLMRNVGDGDTAWKGRTLFKNFTVADGLPDNLVTQVLEMPDGRMAVGTNLGITLFKPSPDFSRLTEMEIYNATTDYPVMDVNGGQGSMLLDSKGIIWAGTGSDKTALVRFDPAAVLRTKEPPTLVIKGIKINEAAICWNDLITAGREKKADNNATPAFVTEEVMTLGRALSEEERDSVRRTFGSIQFDSIRRFYPVPEGLILPYVLNHVTFNFNAIETSKPKLVNYQYQLDGYDKDWNPVSKNNTATYGNIHEGSYTFRVKAQSPDGVWCTPVTYTFTVLPPWYRTWWAYLTYILMFLLALRIFSKLRERKLRMEKAKLERTVEERTAVVEQQKDELLQKNITVEKEKQRSDELLLNILPGEVAEELKTKGASAAKYFDNVTVLFTDFVGFSTASERMTPQELVNELHACFEAFDGIMGKYGIEKIKTVGDAYLAVCGLPNPAPAHAENVISAALEIRDFMADRYATLGSKTFQIRIGVHSGSLVAGIVGVKKFAYDVWGDTVNTAARMEQNSEPGKINISAATYELVKDQFACEYRGEIAAKNKGMLKMYFVW